MRAAYLLIGGVLAAFVAVLVVVVKATAGQSAQSVAVIHPLVALVVLTAIVGCFMAVYRNLALFRGAASPRYFKAYSTDAPPEWVERPARAYMNLLELPVLFYVVCLLMLALDKVDATQVALSWVFVVTRYVHAIIYVGFNYVPLRFAVFLSGFVALAAVWARFIGQVYFT